MVKQNDGWSKLFYVVALCIIMTFTGCGASKHYGAVTISSNPEGAEVVNLKDDTNLGITPARVMFSGEAGTAEYVTDQLRKQGYLDRITSFWVNRRHSDPARADENAIDIHVELEKSKID